MERYRNCRELLQLAPNAQAVQAIMRDYLRSIAPVAAALPDECRPALEGDFDVQAMAVTLLQAELRYEGSEESREFLREAAYTFASAAVRITLLHQVSNVAAA